MSKLIGKFIQEEISTPDKPVKIISFMVDEEGDKYIKSLQKEIERLNNIINEFDKWLLGEKMMFYKGSDGETLIRYNETKNKWLELKGSNSNENL